LQVARAPSTGSPDTLHDGAGPHMLDSLSARGWQTARGRIASSRLHPPVLPAHRARTRSSTPSVPSRSRSFSRGAGAAARPTRGGLRSMAGRVSVGRPDSERNSEAACSVHTQSRGVGAAPQALCCTMRGRLRRVDLEKKEKRSQRRCEGTMLHHPLRAHVRRRPRPRPPGKPRTTDADQAPGTASSSGLTQCVPPAGLSRARARIDGSKPHRRAGSARSAPGNSGSARHSQSAALKRLNKVSPTYVPLLQRQSRTPW